MTLRLSVSFSLCVAGFLITGAPQETLTDDGRVATVTDLQGHAYVRPSGRERWAPLGQRSVVLPGDTVRTESRGAHAVEFELHGGGKLVVGPGSVVELPARQKARLLCGELESNGGGTKLDGPGGFLLAVKGPVWLQSDGQKTRSLDKEPTWLRGFRASSSQEWLGSLLAKVDGRDVPLHVGYHKVDVVIRDQIARTTIEESFVNSTNRRLEGVFSFPLPADASISGFGMWIGNELVEADIVEKQRARAIYEDILRRRKDPGLLEWSGGNLFQARVFPIEAQSDKRIRIQYTQVLPLEGNVLRYRYALRSELLRTHPLRELRIAVQVASGQEIQSATSPSHQVVARHGRNAATVEFVAQEYRAEKDFEAIFALAPAPGLCVVPHRRGSDGYFLVLLAPPDAAASGWQRRALPEGQPLDLVLVADTSASMDAEARAAQARFLTALLALLAPKDRFRLAACDMGTAWWQADSAAVEPGLVDQALGWLAARDSGGWTDLDQAFTEVRRVSRPGTVVVYVGDGIATDKDNDVQAQAGRLQRILAGSGATCHAVTVTSAHERPVLEALARVGGGSVRDAGTRPADVAFALLAEAAEPPVKDLQVEFTGLQVARVYPEVLPNVPAGTQQAILGRFLPTAGVQRGSVTVRGSRAGKPVQFAAELVLQEDEAGNSFVPRLWARRHLDALLAQGTSQAVREEIVAFSEEFGILTPYTSFLVLESDEDRITYGVARRMRMRDGEAFFAEGRDRARAEILRREMAAARSWRVALREQVLREIRGLGRDPRQQPAPAALGRERGSRSSLAEGKDLSGLRYDAGDLLDLNGFGQGTGDREDPADLVRDFDAEPLPAPEPSQAPAERAEEFDERLVDLPGSGKKIKANYRGGEDDSTLGWYVRGSFQGYQGYQGRFGFDQFPGLPAQASRPASRPAPAWPEPVLALVRELDRRAALRRSADGIELSLRDLRRPGRPQQGMSAELLLRAGPAGWHLRQRGDAADAGRDDWCTDGRRGALQRATGLGRVRPAGEGDLEDWQLSLPDWSLDDLTRVFAEHEAALAVRPDGARELTFTARHGGVYRLVVDARRPIVQQLEVSHQGRVHTAWRFSDFVDAGGATWPGRMVQESPPGHPIAERLLTARTLPAAELAAALTAATPRETDGLFLGTLDPEVTAARVAVRSGKALFADQLAVVAWHVAAARWEPAWRAWTAARALCAGRPQADWIELRLLAQSRRGEDLRALALRHAERVRTAPADLRTQGRSLLLDAVGTILSGNERLVLVAALRSADAAGDEQYHFQLLHAGALGQAGQPRAQREALTALCKQYPNRFEPVTALLGVQFHEDDLEAALTTGRVALDAGDVWQEAELSVLYERMTQVLFSRRRLPELLTLCAEWTQRVPSSQDAWFRWLSAQRLLEQMAPVAGFVQAELRRPVPAAEDPATVARLSAAISLAMGDGWQVTLTTTPPELLAELSAFALRCLRAGPATERFAWQVLNHWRFNQSDTARQLRETLRAELRAMAPAPGTLDTMLRLVRFVQLDDSAADQALAKELLVRLRPHWPGGKAGSEREALAEALDLLFRAARDEAGRMAFLRERLRIAPPAARPPLLRELLGLLLTGAWQEQREDEALELLAGLVPEDGSRETRLQEAGSNVRWLADALLRLRTAAALPAEDQLAKLPRSEQQEQRRAAGRKARAELAARLRARAERADAALRPWLLVEALNFAVETGERAADLEGEARELFASLPADTSEPAAALRERTVLSLLYLAAAPRAAAGLPDRVLSWVRQTGDTRAEGVDWRRMRFLLLVALDRASELEQELRGARAADTVDGLWAFTLAMLLAETGRVRDAVAVLEDLRGEIGLLPAHWERLALWYGVLGEAERQAQAVRARWDMTDLNQLDARLYSERRRTSRQRPGVPDELDPGTLEVLAAVLRKAPLPAQWVWRVSELYEQTKDHRVLACLSDGVLGHSAEGCYGFLAAVGEVLRRVHEEATCDALVQRMEARAPEARNDTDRRALELLTLCVARRASELRNQPGPHAERALAALRKAGQGSFAPDERRLLANLLLSLEHPGSDALAAEQLDLLRRLHETAAPGQERFAVGIARWRAHQAHRRHEEAIDGLRASLEELRAVAAPFGLEVREAVEHLAGWLSARRHFAAAEKLLQEESSRAGSAPLQRWCIQRLHQLWIDCLREGGRVAAGEGAELFAHTRAAILGFLRAEGGGALAGNVARLCALHETAAAKGVAPQAGQLLYEFGSEDLPALIRMAPGERQTPVHSVARSLHQLGGAALAVRFLVERIEQEPAVYEQVGEDGMAYHSGRLSLWRKEARNLGDVEGRLRKLVLAACERDLWTGQSRSLGFYHQNHDGFWAELRPEFLLVARRVLEREPFTMTRTAAVAEYLWNGLSAHAEAIGALLGADARTPLTTAVRLRMAEMMTAERRYQEALQQAERLVREAPEELSHRCFLARAFHHAGKPAEALATLLAAAEHWKAAGPLAEDHVAQLGRAALDCSFPAESAGWLEEAIRLRQRLQRRAGDDQLAGYWSDLARAFQALGQEDRAVNAAASTLVLWPPQSDPRRQALAAYRGVLASIRDLPAFLARHDAQVAASGNDAPLLRKVVGEILLERKDAARARVQLLLARDLEPADAELHAALVRACDALGDQEGARRALREGILLQPRELSAYLLLADRLYQAGQEPAAERWLTAMVEILPDDAASHGKLAEAWTARKRYPEAVAQWQQVSRIRTLEPDGWFGRAETLRLAGDKDAARAVLDEVLARRWGDTTQRVHEQARTTRAKY